MNETSLDRLIRSALEEDIGTGDHSTLACIEPHTRGHAVLKVKQDGLLAGIAVAERIFKTVEPSLTFTRLMEDGTPMKNGDIAFEVQGFVHTILKCERLVLNTMQRMSGIATLTGEYVKKLEGFRTRLLDTRKTTPNFRLLEKEAVRIGGGLNHRFGLYDMIMLKDNHIDYCGGIEKAILKADEYVRTNNLNLKIEVETRNLDDVQKVMDTGKVYRIMLDNFTPEKLKHALKIINSRIETEASGGINLGNLQAFAETGVDYISSGSVIHQAVSVDLSLKAVIN